jgi:uncharacterized protein YbcC (UPF0753/DUF2309 family)
MKNESIVINQAQSLQTVIEDAWNLIAPCFPLKNIIAVNPLRGLEDLPFENAITSGHYFFNETTCSNDIGIINRETIKWCQAYFDEGQATIQMPARHLGLYAAFKQLIIFDNKISLAQKSFISKLPHNAIDAIAQCIHQLKIDTDHINLFLKKILTTLPGWASYIKYKAQWSSIDETEASSMILYEYLAIRLIMAVAFLKNPHEFIQPNHDGHEKINVNHIKNDEIKYRRALINKFRSKYSSNEKSAFKNPKAQFVFCIDVRSEPFRRAIESVGDYETFGFAGFFGLPLCVESDRSEKYASCPVLLKPKHTVKESIKCNAIADFKKIVSGKEKVKLSKKIYQSLKYNFTTPFLLAEFLGFWSGVWMILKTFFPNRANQIKQLVSPAFNKSPGVNELGILEGISFSDQVNYAENMLRMIDLVSNFSPVVVLCGHGSKTTNNAYATSLDCGACGGHDGATNARVMATILNTDIIRNALAKRGIEIPDSTKFIAALHNTTTDDVSFFTHEHYTDLEKDLKNAQLKNNQYRSQYLGSKSDVATLSLDWAQTRPEWGLAKNAAFIVGARSLTKEIDLEGRCFLHSYNWENDQNCEMLKTILTAPMIVAQWINAQYLFSTLDPIGYGSGSKITQNITGKIGVMQGNASDLMHGLPLQSTHRTDHEAFHEPIRLMTIISAPKEFITRVISGNDLLLKLTKNEWVKFLCIDPTSKSFYALTNDLEWCEYEHIQ